MTHTSLGDAPEPNVRYRLIFCLAVALTAGVAWGMLGALTGLRLTWAAPVVGLAIGMVVRDISAADKSRRRWAVGFTLIALLAGRASLQSVGANYVSPREARLDMALVNDAVAARLHDNPTVVEQARTGGEGGAPLVGPALLQMLDQAAHETMADLAQTQRRAWAQWYVRTANVAIVRPHRPTWGFTFWDLAIWIVALTTAAVVNPRAESAEDNHQPETADPGST